MPTDAATAATPDYEMIELVFFAYRDFIGEADRLLARYRFGRAHHRVLHFVHRNPGLTIAALLDILGITKQSLARVLKDLIDNGFIQQEAGREDRRQRLLRVTEKGLQLATELAARQSARIGAALAGLPAGERAAVKAFLTGLIDPAGRPSVRALAEGGRGGGA
ncbi:MAG: MarR family winged helix-turn-helix transcriptional regulator [Beijerinckiaceae bacterium]